MGCCTICAVAVWDILMPWLPCTWIAPQGYRNKTLLVKVCHWCDNKSLISRCCACMSFKNWTNHSTCWNCKLAWQKKHPKMYDKKWTAKCTVSLEISMNKYFCDFTNYTNITVFDTASYSKGEEAGSWKIIGIKDWRRLVLCIHVRYIRGNWTQYKCPIK